MQFLPSIYTYTPTRAHTPKLIHTAVGRCYPFTALPPPRSFECVREERRAGMRERGRGGLERRREVEGDREIYEGKEKLATLHELRAPERLCPLPTGTNEWPKSTRSSLCRHVCAPSSLRVELFFLPSYSLQPVADGIKFTPHFVPCTCPPINSFALCPMAQFPSPTSADESMSTCFHSALQYCPRLERC